MSPDKYKSYQSLKDSEQQDADYEILYSSRPSKYIVMAPHGGGIEPGTTEIAEAIAGDTFSFYSFSGTKEKGNRILHIASERFDEPDGLTLVKSSGTAITVHGCEGNDQHVCLWGLNDELVKKYRFHSRKLVFRWKKKSSLIWRGNTPIIYAIVLKRTKVFKSRLATALEN